jgi:hypothetical protein
MRDNPALQSGDLLQFPHCRQWHALTSNPTAPHEYVRTRLFFDCRKGRYFGGTIGGDARYAPNEWRKAAPDAVG